ncbi:hypothetical protein G6M26_06555 [Agrobacterium tumefaciens]|nr:hypothetical protein [Agrobacterium tumefaciens]NTE18178.1 hypothetical protein [Agrobacterium tumefaciens]
MKTCCAFLISLLVSMHLFAQNKIESSGYVGIGTQNPIADLDVKGRIVLSGANLDVNGSLGNLNYLSNTGKMLIGWNRLGGMGETDFISNQGPGGSGGFSFFNYDNSGSQQLLMLMNGHGNVGIGSTAPDQKLTIKGGGIGFDHNSGDKKLYSPQDGVLEWFTNQGAYERGFSVSHQGERRVYLNVLGDSYLMGGNLGIGTLTPKFKLDIADGDIRTSGSLFVSSGNATGAGIKLADDGDIVDLNDGWATHRFSMGLRITNANAGGEPIIQLANGTNNAYTYFNSGNVGIGTSNPTEKLAVNGKIRAQEIKVEASNWPDYVFKDDYQLPPLEEVEKHIKVNKHLPGIPSAAQAERNGIELGEMNKLLLKKIEELMLYVIDLKKETSHQQLQIEELRQKK